MKEMLEIMIKNLVEDTNSVEIAEKLDGDVTTFEVKVANKDMGKVIGKQGRIAKSIRTVMKSISAKESDSL